jgi:hypothetical protein
MNEAHANTFAHYFTMLEASQETATGIGRLLANGLGNRYQDALLSVLGQCMRNRLVATQDKPEANPNLSSLSPRWGKGRSKRLGKTGRLHAPTLHHLFLELGFTDFDAGEIAHFLCARAGAGAVDELKELLSKVVLEKNKLTAL